MFLLLVATLTLPVQFHVGADCDSFKITAPASVVAGETVTLSFTGEVRLSATIDGASVANRTVRETSTIKTYKTHAGKTIELEAGRPGCPPVVRSIEITGAGLSLPASGAAVPYIIAIIAVALAGVMIWKR